MTGWIANTHHGWFDFLAQKAHWPEVNFWTPSDYYAFRGKPGSPFFFRLLSPRNVIGGFGYVQRYARLPEWLAWECFGEANGSPSLDDMSRRLATIREKSDMKGGSALKQIGCIILADAVFFPPEMWVPQPSDWKKANLRYEGYSLIEGEGERIWNECLPAAVMLRGRYTSGAHRSANGTSLRLSAAGDTASRSGRLSGCGHRRIFPRLCGDKRTLPTGTRGRAYSTLRERRSPRHLERPTSQIRPASALRQGISHRHTGVQARGQRASQAGLR